MAKYGEGDKRWIVKERADGTNVHNWHWVERDCLEWSRALLSSLLQGLTLVGGGDGYGGGLVVRTTTLDKLEGEAYLNTRKGKVIPGYELSLSLSFEAELPSPVGKIAGSIEVPYIADENAGEDPEFRVVIRGESGPHENLVKDTVLAMGKPIVLTKIREFVLAMSRGGPAKDELEVKKPCSSTQTPPAAGTPDISPVVKDKTLKEKGNQGFQTIKLTEKFNCRARDLYDILMDEKRWKGFTQSNADINQEVGGRFSVFDGSIIGMNEELQEGKLIVQKWRSSSWPDGLISTVSLTFEEPEPGVTVVKLIQTDVPEEDRYGNATVVENTKKGWRELIFYRIRAVFGFGI